MPRYKERYYAPEDWNFKNHFLAGTKWQVQGSKKDSQYVVTLTTKGFQCDCAGFTFYGKCKHSKQIAEGFDYDRT